MKATIFKFALKLLVGVVKSLDDGLWKKITDDPGTVKDIDEVVDSLLDKLVDKLNTLDEKQAKELMPKTAVYLKVPSSQIARDMKVTGTQKGDAKFKLKYGVIHRGRYFKPGEN